MTIHASLNRKMANLRASSWLNTLEEGITTGALVVSPDVSEPKAAAIRETLTRFTESALPAIRKQLGWSEGIYATRELRVLGKDLIPSEPYMLTQLLRESQALKDGMDALREATLTLAKNPEPDGDQLFAVRIMLRQAISKLDSVPMVHPKPVEPGEIGVRMRSCDEAVEAILVNLVSLRKYEYEEETAYLMAENCEELRRRAQAVADHLRHVGLR